MKKVLLRVVSLSLYLSTYRSISKSLPLSPSFFPFLHYFSFPFLPYPLPLHHPLPLLFPLSTFSLPLPLSIKCTLFPIIYPNSPSVFGSTSLTSAPNTSEVIHLQLHVKLLPRLLCYQREIRALIFFYLYSIFSLPLY